MKNNIDSNKPHLSKTERVFLECLLKFHPGLWGIERKFFDDPRPHEWVDFYDYDGMKTGRSCGSLPTFGAFGGLKRYQRYDICELLGYEHYDWGIGETKKEAGST